MQMENITIPMIKYTKQVLGEYTAVKFIGAILLQFLGMIYIGNQAIIHVIILLFFIDLITGTIKSWNKSEISSKEFFKGCTKLFVYLVFLFIASSVDLVINAGITLRLMSAFIIITDSISILENFEELGYNTPMFLKKRLKVYKRKIEKGE